MRCIRGRSISHRREKIAGLRLFCLESLERASCLRLGFPLVRFHTFFTHAQTGTPSFSYISVCITNFGSLTFLFICLCPCVSVCVPVPGSLIKSAPDPSVLLVRQQKTNFASSPVTPLVPFTCRTGCHTCREDKCTHAERCCVGNFSFVNGRKEVWLSVSHLLSWRGHVICSPRVSLFLAVRA